MSNQIVIEPQKGWLGINFKELFDYRDLIVFLAWRDIMVQYKQTIFGESMQISLFRLTEKFTLIENVKKDTSNIVKIIITPGVNTYNLDISAFLNAWYNLKEPNYGIILEPFVRSTSPNFVVLKKPDSFVINYTSLPEVE